MPRTMYKYLSDRVRAHIDRCVDGNRSLQLYQEFAPGPVPQEALDYFDEKEYRIGFDHRDVWREEHAQAFTVAKAMSKDLLADVRGSLREALKEGTPFKKWAKEIRPNLEKRGWWGEKKQVDPKTGKEKLVQLGSPRRLEIIYRTNMRTARAVGQWDRIQRTKAVRPNLLYALGPSIRHREQHLAWADTILPVDHPFWSDHMPPNGWLCKCHVVQLSDTQATRKGGVTPEPDTTPVPHFNKRTGETEMVPIGIDPGWDYNPGIERRT